MASQKHLSSVTSESTISQSGRAERPAVFLDRDGTLIEEREYLSDPQAVALIPGAAEALAQLRAAGFALVLVTNQSAVGRGWLSEATLGEIHNTLERELKRSGVTLDAIFFCPDVEANDSAAASRRKPDPLADRKPGAGMLIRAARDLGLDLSESWIVGDHVRDLEAGRSARCRGSLLVLTGHGEKFRKMVHPEDIVCRDLLEAAQRILEADGH
jgi:D-glycero-D-manno-heptose 1,7-bisphosphate phosphatase